MCSARALVCWAVNPADSKNDLTVIRLTLHTPFMVFLFTPRSPPHFGATHPTGGTPCSDPLPGDHTPDEGHLFQRSSVKGHPVEGSMVKRSSVKRHLTKCSMVQRHPVAGSRLGSLVCGESYRWTRLGSLVCGTPGCGGRLGDQGIPYF